MGSCVGGGVGNNAKIDYKIVFNNTTANKKNLQKMRFHRPTNQSITLITKQKSFHRVLYPDSTTTCHNTSKFRTSVLALNSTAPKHYQQQLHTPKLPYFNGVSSAMETISAHKDDFATLSDFFQPLFV